jgi:hypothetical protein
VLFVFGVPPVGGPFTSPAYAPPAPDTYECGCASRNHEESLPTHRLSPFDATLDRGRNRTPLGDHRQTDALCPLSPHQAGITAHLVMLRWPWRRS